MDGTPGPLWKRRDCSVSEEDPRPLAWPARSQDRARQFGPAKGCAIRRFLERAKGFEPSTPTLARQDQGFDLICAASIRFARSPIIL